MTERKEAIMKIYRQGDVMLREVKTVPKAAKAQAHKDRIVLAYGEVTGHAHAIEDMESVDVFVTAEGGLYLRVKAETALTHEEHGLILLPPGNYERIIQREYSPESIRNVAD